MSNPVLDLILLLKDNLGPVASISLLVALYALAFEPINYADRPGATAPGFKNSKISPINTDYRPACSFAE